LAELGPGLLIMALAIAQRVGIALFVVWGTATLMFILLRLAPGDPAILLVGPSATAEEIEAARQALGLDEPLWSQYWTFLQNLVVLDFGYSRRLGGDAMSLVLQRIPATVELALAAAIIGTVVGFPLGVYAGRRPGSLADRFVTATSLTLQSLPGFWVGVMLILVFSRQLNLLPSSGRGGLEHLILPATALAIQFVGVIARLTQSGLAGILNDPFMQTARAKGIGESAVVRGHGVRNMLIPVVTVVGLQVGALLGGAVVMESVFSWPGLGRLLVDGIANRDYSVVQAATVVIALIVAVTNILVDLVYIVLDPRIRLAAAK
jgi:ABC-type dipeptide/oligopeptide/nickel transport system permease component